MRDFFEEANQHSMVASRQIITASVTTSADVRNCHILFVCPQDVDGLSNLLTEARRHNVLTVGQSAGFIHQGGMVNFVDTSERVRFQVNARAARRAGIRMSARLLNISEVVDEEGNAVTPDPKLFR